MSSIIRKTLNWFRYVFDYIRKYNHWFLRGDLSPEVTLCVIFLGFGFSFIHRIYLFLVILNRLPEMFNILKHIY